MKPKKSLGQNFLTSIPARNAIIKAGEIKVGDEILEIGPGKGMLTTGLLETKAHVTAIEKDNNLISFLEEKFIDEIKNKQLTIINDDVLKIAISKKQIATSYKLIANIPYYITGAIIEKYLTEKNQPSMMVILVQKEVAERIVARDGKESILSMSVKVYGEPSIVYRVDKGSFFPIPSVDSAVLKIKNISRKNFANKKQEEIFFRLVKKGFAHKRKVLISNLKETGYEVDWKNIFEKNKLDIKVRAEDLRLEDWLGLIGNI